MTASLGDFLIPAGEHIALAASWHGDLPDDAADGVIRELSRVITALGTYLGDVALPDNAGHARPHGTPLQETAAAREALRRSALFLRREADLPDGPEPEDAHPVTASLSAAAGYLMTSRDLLQATLAPGPYTEAAALAGRFHWAAVAASPPLTAALLAEITGHARTLAPWAAHLSQTASADPARQALHDAARWLYTAAGTTASWQQHRSVSPCDRGLLHDLPVTVLPARRPPSPAEPIAGLCAGITDTATRLRYAAVIFAAEAVTSPAANSVSWRRHALGIAITAHATRLTLRGLTERAAHLSATPALRDHLRRAAAAADETSHRHRAVTWAWDTLTTAPATDAPLTPVATEISDLALRAGRLAYRNPRWEPGIAHSGPRRDPAELAPAAGDIATILSALHHAADAIHVITAADREAVCAAAAARLLYFPTWLLPDATDPPYRYCTCPPLRVRQALDTYNAASRASTDLLTVLDELAIHAQLPSAPLTAPRRNPAPALPAAEPAPGEQPATIRPPEAGHVQKMLHDLRITEPAMLTRAELADAAALNLITEATRQLQRRQDTRTTLPRRPTASRPRHAR